MKEVVLFSFLLVGLCLAGCSQEEPAAPSAPAQQKADLAPVSTPMPGLQPPPVVPPPNQAQTPVQAADSSTPAAGNILANVDANDRPALINLNAAYQSFFDVEMRWATDLNELVTSKRINELPAAPAGRRYAIDTVNHQVILVRQ